MLLYYINHILLYIFLYPTEIYFHKVKIYRNELVKSCLLYLGYSEDFTLAAMIFHIIVFIQTLYSVLS